MTATVTLSHLSVSFVQQEILHAINVSFLPRTVSVLVGRSGSGKTTLLRAINRLNEEFPYCKTSGQVTIDFGKGIEYAYSTGISPKKVIPLVTLRQKVGMLFQTPNLFPVSIYNNLAMPLRLTTQTPKNNIAERVEYALQTVGLWDDIRNRLNAPAEHLSGGQQQRLCLARLLLLEPKVLLLDEPTASLDIHTSQEIEELLTQLADSYTIIMVSHSLRQATRLADRILVCDQGRITQELDAKAPLPEELIANFL